MIVLLQVIKYAQCEAIKDLILYLNFYEIIHLIFSPLMSTRHLSIRLQTSITSLPQELIFVLDP
jgi:phosphate starvation-inducible membrane PsiE